MLSPLAVLERYAPHEGTLDSVFESRCAKQAEADFLVCDNATLTWSDFGKRYRRFAGALAARGVRHGMRVAVVARNGAVHPMALFALARLGAVMVPVNPDFGVRELAYVIGHADVQGIIAGQDVLPRVREVMPGLAAQPWLLVCDAAAGTPDRLDDFIDSGADVPPAYIGAAHDTCVIIYTSGTTGFPKGVMHSQRNLVTAGEANVARLHLQPEDRILVILPFFHVNAVFYSLGGTLAAGACMIVVPRFSASAFWHVAADHGATVVNMIDAIGNILCARDRSEYRADHRLRAAYGVRKGAAATFRGEFGIRQLFSGFGMTEVPGVTCNLAGEPDRPGSMGVLGSHPDPARPWAECRVVGEDGHDVAVDEPGELWVRHPIVMQGYFRDPEQTAEAFSDGWFRTGDLVRRDVDGFFYHLSRIKDIIRRRGENISAAELEAVVNEHPGVLESAAVAVPSELGEDEILIAVVARPGIRVSEREIADWCGARLSSIKSPRFVALIDALPHTPTHKIAKAAIRSDPAIRAAAIDLEGVGRGDLHQAQRPAR